MIEPAPANHSASKVVRRRPTFVEEIDIESLPIGERSRLMVELVENGIGQPIRVPVVVARGRRPGPVFGITAALHGNELNGIPVIHKLLDKLNLRTLRGSVVCVIVANMPGLMVERREFIDGQDLNHIMPGKPDGKLSQVYAYNLVNKIVRHFDYLIDLHTASQGRVNSLYVRADLRQEITAQMAYLLRPQIVVHNPPSDYTLRGTADEMDHPAITVEICDPQKFQRDPIARTVRGIRRVLNHVKMLPSRQTVLPVPTLPVLCKKSYWILAKRGGLMTVHHRITDRVKQGELLATQVNIYGDLMHEYLAPEDGIIIGHCVNPMGQTGERIVHLGIEMDEEEKHAFELESGGSLGRAIDRAEEHGAGGLTSL